MERRTLSQHHPHNEIQRRIAGISQRMLTLTLKRLETDGIVTRTLFPSVPPRVDYELTQLGQTLRGALVPLHVWAAKNKNIISMNRLGALGEQRHRSPKEIRGDSCRFNKRFA